MDLPMPPTDIDLSFLRDLLLQAGALALERRQAAQAENGNGQVAARAKADHTPVTEVDQAVEAFLIERIRAKYPGHTIVSEESGLQGEEDLTPAPQGSAKAVRAQRRGEKRENSIAWVLDPIDGTRAFASGLPVWGISAGVLRDGQPHAGGFYLPMTGELYWGTCSEAWHNDHRLPQLPPGGADPLLSFLAVPSNFHKYFMISAPRIRSLGSTAAHLAYVASGAAAGMLTRNTSLWDLAGVLPLALAVGVELAYLSGRPFNAGDLLDGKPLAEPLLAARPGGMETARGWINPFSPVR